MHVFKNRVEDTSATTGTGTLTLSGSPAAGKNDFTVLTDGDTIEYAIEDGSNREEGRGTWNSSGNTLTRDEVYSSTSAGSKINCSGSQTVRLTPVDYWFNRVESNTTTHAQGVTSGLETSNNATDASHDIDFESGVCAVSDASSNWKLVRNASTITKQIDAAFSAGDNQGGLDTGAVASDTWYHLWIVAKSDDTVDFLFSTSATAPTMPAGYDFKRRIGAVLTDGSANITGYTQHGSRFIWDVPTRDFATSNPGTSAVLETLTTPLGVQTVALTAWQLQSGTPSNEKLLITSPDQTDTAPSTSVWSMRIPQTGTTLTHVAGHLDIVTNTSSQVRYRLDASDSTVSVQAVTYGWIDPRGGWSEQSGSGASGGGLGTAAVQSSSFTAAANKMYPIDCSSLGANIDITLPASPTDGDEVGFFIATENTTDTGSSSFAAAPFWGAEPIGSTSIEGESYTHASGDGLAKWGLLVEGESLVLRWDNSGSTWRAVNDGANPHLAKGRRDAAQSISDNTVTRLAIDATAYDNAGLIDSAADRVDIKRDGKYSISGGWKGTSVGSGKSVWAAIYLNAANVRWDARYSPGAGTTQTATVNESFELDAGDYVELFLYHNNGASMNTDTNAKYRPVFSICEVR